MDKYIVFAGRKIPISTSYPVFLFENDSAPSYYHPDRHLSPDKLMQMALLRPTLQNYSFRFDKQNRFNRTFEQLFNVPREEVEALGQHIIQIALHHDVTMNAIETYNVLCTRGLSTHFCVNYDGALYQYMDCYHTAWATGDNNNWCIAIDMNNPVYPELRSQDPAGALREIYQGKVNGSLKTMLGYTEAQYETIIALMKAFVSPVNVPGEPDPWIPLPVVAENCFPPISETGEVINRLLANCTQFKGFLGHYHCSANKWDPGPAFDWLRVLSGIKGKRNSLPIMLDEDNKNIADCGGERLNKLFDTYYHNAENSNGGWYPVGSNQSWHSGIHLSAPEGSPIINMMEGTIVAIRNVKTVALGDPSFVLVRHEREETGPDGNPRKVFWYSLYMHLQRMKDEEDCAKIPWVAGLLGTDFTPPDSVIHDLRESNRFYEQGVPHVVDGTVPRKNYKEILEAFFRGDIILTQIPCDAGSVIGTIGVFGDKPDRRIHQVHVEVFSAENLFAHGSAQMGSWGLAEGDYSEYSLVNVKKLIKPIKDFVKSMNATGKDPTFLKTSEIGAFYQMSEANVYASRRDEFRSLICYHRSEWSPLMNWTKTAVHSVGWQWESEKEFGEWLVLWLPFQWMTTDVTTALDLPRKHYFFTYHPIYMLEQLNQTYAGDIRQTAEEASDGEFKDNANEVANRLAELIKLNKRLENGEELSPAEKARHDELYELMDDHLDDEKGDIGSETVYDYNYDPNFERWEPGEWQPPPRVNLKNMGTDD
ncbi:MAG: N-acetylmuramoyl-L-alanine amidase [Proteobacteria bacterium]|nr:N-acetylmuramoyl-L-alanine amidase [Pseudomonadota bacterium]